MIKLVDVLLKEESSNYKIEGILISDLTRRNQADILSDIRSLKGVTIVRAKEYDPEEQKYENKHYYSYLTIKVDPHPFIGTGGFGQDQVNELIANVKKIKGVKTFKQTGNVQRIKTT
jgi:hypothetical protein